MDGRTVRFVKSIRSVHAWVAVPVWIGFSLWFFSVGPYATMAEQGGVPDEDFWQSPSDVEARVAGMDGATESAYRTFLWTDVAFAALYGLGATALIARACRLVRNRMMWHVTWLPFVGAAADVAENASMFGVLGGGSAVPFVVFQSIKAVATSAALVLALAAFIAIVGHSIMHPMRPVKRAR